MEQCRERGGKGHDGIICAVPLWEQLGTPGAASADGPTACLPPAPCSHSRPGAHARPTSCITPRDLCCPALCLARDCCVTLQTDRHNHASPTKMKTQFFQEKSEHTAVCRAVRPAVPPADQSETRRWLRGLAQPKGAGQCCRGQSQPGGGRRKARKMGTEEELCYGR